MTEQPAATAAMRTPSQAFRRRRSAAMVRNSVGARRDGARSDLLFDAGGFAAEVSEVVKLRSANITTSFHLDLRNSGTVGLEYTLYPLAVRNLSHGKR